jgi:Domain of unknown function (DUF4832)/Beta-galactosidase
MVQHKKSRHLQRGMLIFSIIILIAGILILLLPADTSSRGIKQSIVRLQHKNTIKNQPDNDVILDPQLSNVVILNPGKGWVLNGMPSDHRASTLAYAAVGYLRYDWSTIEPTEGHYNWSPIDSALKAWKAQGKQFAFGVMNADSSNAATPYVTPAWVFADGATSVQSRSFDQITGVTSIQHIPVWNDPIFMQKVQTFLYALAQRYDSNPTIAYIDVRSYGNWGQQSVYGIPPSVALSPADMQHHIQMYRNAFKHVQIIVPWGSSTYNSVYDWAVNNGVGIRRDGIMVGSTGSELRRANGKVPSVFEFYSSYQWLKQKGYWNDATLIKDVTIGSPSYIEMGQWDNDADDMLTNELSLVHDLANKMGYQFVLSSATIPNAISNNQPTTISLSWSNQGVASLYKTCYVAIAILDSANQVVQQQWFTTTHPNAWAPGTTTQESTFLTFSNLKTGTYKLAVGLYQNPTDANPTYKIGNQGRTASGWYVLSSNLKIA